MRIFKKGQKIIVFRPQPRKAAIKGWTGTVAVNRVPGVAWVEMDQDLPEAMRVDDQPRRILLSATECRDAD